MVFNLRKVESKQYVFGSNLEEITRRNPKELQ